MAIWKKAGLAAMQRADLVAGGIAQIGKIKLRSPLTQSGRILDALAAVCDTRIVERLQKVSDPPPEQCPECGGKMAKIMSRNSFQLKGGGWYKDLYSSSKNSKSDKAA